MNKHIFIVGPRRLQSELMVCKITCGTGLKCQCAEDLDKLLAPAGAAASACEERTHRLVMIDYQSQPTENLTKTLQMLKAKAVPDLSVAFYNMKKGTGFESRALELGAKGFFYEDDSVDTLTKGVGNIFDGDLWVSRKQMVEYLLLGTSYKEPQKKRDHLLTRREVEVLSLVAKGESNDGISEQLCVSHHTIRTHVYNIFKKINVSNRLQASIWAAEHLNSYLD